MTAPLADKDPHHAHVNATHVIGERVADVANIEWKLELAGLDPSPSAVRRGVISNGLTQLLAGMIALGTHALILLRHGGTSPASARDALRKSPLVIGLHAEDSTRTRHLRGALERWLRAGEAPPPVLLLGRPSASVEDALAALDANGDLAGLKVFRPLSFGSFVRALGLAISLLTQGASSTRTFTGALSFRDRVAISYRMVQGAVHYRWWQSAVGKREPGQAVLGHTGTADVTRLEMAMQHSGLTTAHAVHGANVGWSFAGISDVAQFNSAADARLGASLPAYTRCLHLPLDRPALSPGNGDWALLTSYTHPLQPGLSTDGAEPDCQVVEWVRAAAEAMGQDAARIFWRPHPQIANVPAHMRLRLEEAVAAAGFVRWPEELPYTALAQFTAVVTTPSTAMLDALRLGQPAIVAALLPLQRDLVYTAHPLTVQGEAGLREALTMLTDERQRTALFERAWHAIEPGAALDLKSLLAAI